MTVGTNQKLKTVELYFSGYIFNYIQRFVAEPYSYFYSLTIVTIVFCVFLHSVREP